MANYNLWDDGGKNGESVIPPNSEKYEDDFIDVTNGRNEFGDGNPEPISEEEMVRKHRRKVNGINTVIALAINCAPIINKVLISKKKGTVLHIKKEIISAVVLSSPSVLLTVDDLFLKGKLQTNDNFRETVKHVRNVTTIVSLYGPVYGSVQESIYRNKNKRNFQENTMPARKSILTGEIMLKAVGLISPYIVNEICDKSLSTKEKLHSIIPIGVFGTMIRDVMSLNPNTAKIYEKSSMILRLGSIGTDLVGGAVISGNSNNNKVQKGFSAVSNILNTAMSLTGVNNNNGGPGYSWSGNNGNSWNGYGGGNNGRFNNGNYNPRGGGWNMN